MKKLLISLVVVSCYANVAVAQDSLADLKAKAVQIGATAVAVSSAATTKAVSAVKTAFGAEVSVKNKQLVVLNVVPGTSAEKCGLLKDDVITAVNGVTLTGKDLVAQFTKLTASSGKGLKLQVSRTLSAQITK